MTYLRPLDRRWLLIFCVLLLAVPAFGPARPTAAQSTLIVTRETDSNDGVCDDDCSLREAIAAAAGGDRIGFDAAVSRVTLTIDELQITSNLTIDGGTGVIIERSDSAGDFRIFTVSGAGVVVTFESLTIRNGRAPGHGGGIWNDDAVLTLINSTVSDNQSSNGRDGDIAGNGGHGGGIYNSGTLRIIGNSAISSNRTGNGGSSSRSGGSGGRGGGIYNVGIVTLEQSMLNSNRTGNGGSGSSSSRGGQSGSGGGIYNEEGIVTLRNSSITDNQTGSSGTSGSNGGGIANQDGRLTIVNSTLAGNRTGNGGDADSFAGDGGYGGGIANEDRSRRDSIVTIINSTISGNQTGNGGSADSFGGGGGHGGGVYNEGTATIINSTISGNQTGNGGSANTFGGDGGDGAGIYNIGFNDDAGELTIVHSTIVGNQSGNGGSGIRAGTAGAAGGIRNIDRGTATIVNTIIGNQLTGADVVDTGDIFSAQGRNIVTDGSLLGRLGVVTDDPQLGPLQDNGGPTFTHLPMPGSAAIDNGDNQFVNGTIPLVDTNGDGIINSNDMLNSGQRGFARIVNDIVDIGAVEVGAAAIAYSINVENAEIAEGSENNPVLVTVARSGAIGAPGSVDLILGGDATLGNDYLFGLDSSGAGFDPASGRLTFAADTPEAVFALQVQDDGLVEPDETVTVSLTNPTAPDTATITAPASIQLTIRNDDVAGITVDPPALTVTQGGNSAMYRLVLDSRPAADVTINISADASLNTNISSLTFTPANWNIPQSVTVSAANDTLLEVLRSGMISHDAASADSTYNAIPIGAVTVTIQDNDRGDSPSDTVYQVYLPLIQR
jgi:hypothetical protein